MTGTSEPQKDLMKALRESMDAAKARRVGSGPTPAPRRKCPGHGRHWFVVRGAVGLRTPRCQRCEAPNPRPLNEQERIEYDAYLLSIGNFRSEEWA